MQLQRGSFKPAFRNRPRSLAPARNVAANSGARKTIPIFPLNVVALPSATVPLMIFEARYRVLFNTLLAGDPNVEEGLVQKESPFCGTREFGMCYVDKDGRVAAIGTVLHIKEALFMKEDGRLLTTSKGGERFEIKNIVKQKPVLVAEVELIEEDQQEPTSEAIELAREVSDLLRSTIKLNVKMNNVQASEDQLEPEELADLGPRDISFFVASFFSDFKLLQQNLLEETSTVSRLQREKDILNETLKYYSAASALKSAFNSSDTETTQ